jgi:hypothetical protein
MAKVFKLWTLFNLLILISIIIFWKEMIYLNIDSLYLAVAYPFVGFLVLIIGCILFFLIKNRALSV